MKKTRIINIAILCLLTITFVGCKSLTTIDPMSNEEIDRLVANTVKKLVVTPRAKKLFASNKTVKIELLNLKNNTRTYMNREWETIKANLEELFINYENVEFYNADDRRRGQKSINELQSEGLIKTSQQKKTGEQEGADYNIQVTITETQLTEKEKQYRLIIRWYNRETQRPVSISSVYFTK
jgi:competence protein ComGC